MSSSLFCTHMQEWLSSAWCGYTAMPRPWPGGRWSSAPLVVRIPWTSCRSAAASASWGASCSSWAWVSSSSVSTAGWVCSDISPDTRSQLAGSLQYQLSVAVTLDDVTHCHHCYVYFRCSNVDNGSPPFILNIIIWTVNILHWTM